MYHGAKIVQNSEHSWRDIGQISNVFNDSKTFVIQSQIPVTLEYPGGALSDTTDNLLYTSFPIFQG